MMKQPSCLDLDAVVTWEKIKPTDEANVVIIPPQRYQEKEVIAAKFQELQNWEKFKVFEEVDDHGQKSISTTWVITEKKGNG